jgi:D-alanyl-D-alanine carboxypeptidase
MTMFRRTARFAVALITLSLAAGCGPSALGSPGATAITPTPTAVASQTPSVPPATPPSLTELPPYPAAALDAETAAKLQAALDGLVEGGAPDAIGAVVTADGWWSGAAGIDGPDGRLATPEDEFNIASISKPIFAALILRLAQDGEMDLDAPISEYLGGLKVDSNGATVRQVLAMRSGIGETTSAQLAEVRADCSRVWTRKEVLAAIPAPHAEPGASYEYSNPGYKLLGFAAEQVTGDPIETALDELMFAPLGSDRILLQRPGRTTPEPWALPIVGHENDLDLADYGTGGTLPCVALSTYSFQSAIATDAPTLARWGWELFSGTLLDRDSLAAMTTIGPNGWGLGIERLPEFGTTLAFGTRGHQTGYNSFLFILPEPQIVAVLFINDGNADVEAGGAQLVRALRE